MPDFRFAPFFTRRKWISALAAFIFIKTSGLALAQSNSTTNANSATGTTTNTINPVINDGSSGATALAKKAGELRVGPFDLHPQFAFEAAYDDNVLLSSANTEADTVWRLHPALQAVAGDDAALIAYRDQNNDVLSLSPGDLIFQQPDDWPGSLLILEYGPGFQIFDRYTANNSIDEFATFKLLLPMHNFILDIEQEYQLQKTDILEFDHRTTVETIPTTLSAAYKFDDKTSVESDIERVSVGYDQSGLTGYTEYKTENWLNYAVSEDLPISLGALAGLDDVPGHQDQTFEQLRLRCRYIFTQKLTFDVSVGGELRQFESGLPETLSPVFDIAGQYQLAERTWVKLSASRQQYASIYNGYNYASTGAALEVRQGITDRFTAAVTAGYYSLDFTPITATLAKYTGYYYLARISLDAKIVHHLTGEVFYQGVSSHSQANGDFNDNQTGVQLTLNF
jgi:hypothetical protein